MTRRCFLVIIPVCAVGACVWWYWTTGSKSQVPTSTPKAITIELWREAPMAVTNLVSMKSVVKMLGEGRPAEEHQCKNQGTIEIQFADGQNLSVGFSPGHDPSSYEYGVNGHLFTISRLRFLETLKAAGFDVKKIPME